MININANIIDNDLRTKIQVELIEKSYYSDIEYNLNSKSRWKFIGDLTEALAQILLLVATILSFASGTFDNKILAFVSGAVGVGSIVFLRFSSYAMKESQERTEQVNRILEQLGINKIPDIIQNMPQMVDV